jgi:diaminopimelate decarboxylase
MGSNYNSRTRPAEILVEKSGSIKTLRKRESFDDLIKNEI